MKRRLVTLAAAASLLLCVASVGLWIWSHWRSVGINVTLGQQVLTAESSSGRMWLLWFTNPPPPLPPLFSSAPARPEARPGSSFGRQVVRVNLVTQRGLTTSRLVWFPIWLMAVVTGALGLTMIGLPAWRRSRRRRSICNHCGHDLRATPDRCPKCGGVPAAPAAR